MIIKSWVASNDVAVVVELTNGKFACVNIRNKVYTMADWAESFLKFGYFKQGNPISESTKRVVESILKEV